MNKPLSSQEHIGPDGKPVQVPVIPADATPEEMEGIIAEEGQAVMTDEQQAAFDQYVSEGVTRDGRAR